MIPVPVINQQKPEKIIHASGAFLDAVKTFHTIQGEGPFTGFPAVFVRLSGCNLQCPACDTDYTSGREMMPVTLLYQSVKNLLIWNKNTRLVVITGGEPFRQNITQFVEFLLAAGLMVQIETNGTVFLPGFPYDHEDLCIVCSPKTGSVHPLLAPKVSAWKYIVQAGNVSSVDGLPLSTMGAECGCARPVDQTDNQNIYIQPLDVNDSVENAKNMTEAVRVCMEFGYTLSLQIHKIANLP